MGLCLVVLRHVWCDVRWCLVVCGCETLSSKSVLYRRSTPPVYHGKHNMHPAYAALSGDASAPWVSLWDLRGNVLVVG